MAPRRRASNAPCVFARKPKLLCRPTGLADGLALKEPAPPAVSGLAPTNGFPRSPHISAHLPAGIRHCRLQAAQSTDVERRAGPRRPRPALRSPAQRATTPHRFCARCRFQERRTFPAKAGVPTKRTTGLRDTERAMTQRNVANLRALLETWDVEAWKRGEEMGLLDPEVTYVDTTLPDHVGETYRGHAGGPGPRNAGSSPTKGSRLSWSESSAWATAWSLSTESERGRGTPASKPKALSPTYGRSEAAESFSSCRFENLTRPSKPSTCRSRRGRRLRSRGHGFRNATSCEAIVKRARI